MREAGFSVRLLSAGPFVTMIDRFAVAPVLIPIAPEFRAPVGAVAIAATAYYFAYGLAQPFWGFASGRLGRTRSPKRAAPTRKRSSTRWQLWPRRRPGREIRARSGSGLVRPRSGRSWSRMDRPI